MMRRSLENEGASACVVVAPPPSHQRATNTSTKKRFPGRWSLRHLIYSSPILNRRRSQTSSGSSKSHNNKNHGKDVPDSGHRLGGSSKEVDKNHHVEIHQATSRTSVFTTSTKSGEVALSMECPLCFAELCTEDFCELGGCGHRACIPCIQQYLRVEITESRVCISCPECTEPMHPNEIRSIVDHPNLYDKYEDFMVRRVLAVDPDTRWCPAPDCSFAVIASGCASCPKLKCERPGCDSYFCYHCKAEWHPNQTCDAARAQRSPNIRSSSITYSQDSQHRDDIKPCPRCQVLIVKMDDGSCNHMMCAVCGAEFCWLCMKEISDLHYLSPSGCTFWGKKPWSRKKKILWQLGTLVGAPVGIALVAGITIPAMIIGIPVWVGRKLYTRYKTSNKHKRNAAIVGGVLASVMISPVLAGLAVGIGVPILLFYVYGVVPVSLCRSGGCGGSAPSDDPLLAAAAAAAASAASGRGTGDGASSRTADPSIGEPSLSMASGSQMLREADRESASMAALAGSHRLEVQAELAGASGSASGRHRHSIGSLTESGGNASLSLGGDDGAASTKALAGSVLNYFKPGDSCSCQTTEDCASVERVRFDDNVSFIAAEKTSIGSSCSFRARCNATPPSTVSTMTTTTKLSRFEHQQQCAEEKVGDGVYVDIFSPPPEEPSQKPKNSKIALLRSQFFHSTFLEEDDSKREASSIEDLGKQSLPLISDLGLKAIPIKAGTSAYAVVDIESSNL